MRVIRYSTIAVSCSSDAFSGGSAQDFQFVLGEGQMLKEFEDAVRGMKVGESKTFPLTFPEEYHGKEVAGKTADFLVTLKKVEAGQLPEVDGTLAKQLGVQQSSLLRALAVLAGAPYAPAGLGWVSVLEQDERKLLALSSLGRQVWSEFSEAQ